MKNNLQRFSLRLALILFLPINALLAQNTLNNIGFTNSDPKAEAAYSLRLLSTAYTGPLVRVTISGSTYDVWPDGSGNFSMTSLISAANPGTIPGTVSVNALSTVATGNTATIAIWYDQSGSSRNNNCIQNTVGNQPRIINAGTIDVQNGKPAALFTQSSSQILVSTNNVFTNFGSGHSLLSVYSRSSVGTTAGLFSLYEVASDNYLNFYTPSSTSMRFESGVNGGNIQSTFNTISANTLTQSSGTGIENRVNGGSLSTGSSAGLMSSSFTAPFRIGNILTHFWSGYISENICFPVTLTNTERQTAENNQMAYFSISKPTITSFTPTNGAAGTTVNITGTNFNTTASNNIVNFGAAKATVTAASATELTVTLPAGATLSQVSVTNIDNNLTAFSSASFIPKSTTYKTGYVLSDFASKVDFSHTGGPYNLSSADMDGDGKTDLIYSQGSNISILRNTSTTGSITGSRLDITQSGLTYIGDVNGDGKPDLCTNNGAVRVNTSSPGSLSFASTVTISGANGLLKPIFVDIDGDGLSEWIEVAFLSDILKIAKNTTSGGVVSFGSFNTFSTGSGSVPYDVSYGDFDADGKQDIAVLNRPSGSNYIMIFKNTSTVGSISFASPITVSNVGTNSQCLRIGDIDGDGKIDMAISSIGDDAIYVVRNTTSGTISFATPTSYATGGDPVGFGMGDFTGDGKPDFISANYVGNNNSFLENTSTSGSVSFATRINLTGGAGSRAAEVFDYDGDGKLDLCVATEGDKLISIYRNTPTLSSNADLSALTLSSGTLSPVFASGTTSYTASVSNATSTITVTATRSNSGATLQVRVNGGSYTSLTSGVASSSLALNVGSNTIDVRVTAQDGTTIKTYSTTVTRANSNDANLSAMTLSSGTLSPVFSSGTISYTASVVNATSSITITPTSSDAGATIQVRVNGGTFASVTSGNASGSLNLDPGSNTIDVKVTAADLTTVKTYTTTVTRACPTATATAGGSQTICSNASAIVSGASSSNGTILWTENGAGSITAGATTLTPTYTAQSGDGGNTVTLTMTVTGAGACSTSVATASYTLTINAAPLVPVISGPANACGYSSQNYSVTIPNGTSSYVWTAGSSSITAGQGTSAATVLWTVTSGLGSVGVVETATNTCTATSSPFGTILATGANPVITGSATVCANSTATYTLSSILGGRTYAWSVIGGTISGSNTGSSISVNWGAAGAGSVTCAETVTASSCVTTTSPYNVTKNPIPTATIGGGSTVCLNAASPNVTFTGANGTSPYTFTYNIDGGSNVTVVSTGNIATVAVPTSSAATKVYNLVSVVDASSTLCSQTQTGSTTFVINPIPTYTGGTSQTICSGSASSVSLTANTTGGTNSFAWTSSAVGGISGNSNSNGSTLAQTLTSSNTTATNVIYAVTPTYTFNSVGCSGIAGSVTVTVNPIPVNNGTSTQTICSGTASSVSLTANTSGGTNTFAYTTGSVTGLSGNAGGSGSSIAQTLSTTNTSPTNAVYSVIPTYTNNAVGCAGSASNYTVTVNPIPVNTGTTSQTICSGTASSVSLSANTTGGTNTFAWTTGAGLNITGNVAGTGSSIAQTLSSTNLTPFFITYSVTPTFTNNAISCNGTATNANVTINPIPLYTGATSQTICSGTASSASLTANTTGGTNTFAWTSSAVAGLSGNSAANGSTIVQTLSTTNTSPTNGVYVVTPTFTGGSVGCNGNTGSVTLTVNPLPVYTGTTSQTICSSLATSLSLTANTTGGTNTFAWTSASVSGLSGNVAGSGSSIAQTLTNSNLTPANAVYSILSTFTNNSVACNNTTNGSATVTVNPRPTASSGGSVTICSGQSTTVTGATANNGTISWSENGAGFISTGGTTLTPTYSSDALDAGNTVTLTMTVTGSGICTGQTATASYSIAVNPSPTPLVSGPATGCGYTSGTFTTPSNSGRTYTWTVSAPNNLVSGQGTNSISVFYNQASGSAVTGVTETITATGCQITSAFYNTTVNEGSNPSVSGSNNVCASSTSSYSTTIETGHTYLWSVSGGTISGSATGNSVTINWGAAGAGSVSVLETVTATSCSNTSTLNVTKNPQPTATAGGSQTICSNGTATISSSSANGTISWTENGAGSITSGGITNAPVYTAAAGDAGNAVTLTMTVLSTNACAPQSAIATYTVNVNPLPTASIGGTTAVCKNGTAPTVTLTGAAGTSPYTFTYNINGGSNLTVVSTGNVATVTAPTGTAGTFAYNLVSVVDASSTLCTQTQSGTATITVNPLPTASIGGTTAVCKNGTAPTVTLTGAAGTS
ncbi:MAG: beta strand repeat-containing protein, partial [Bacteroidia bacterium]